MITVVRILNVIENLLPSLVLIALVAFAVGYPVEAIAEDLQTLPYENGIKVFRRSMTGPVPFVISLVGIIACGAMLIFGGEISGFMRTMVFIILVVAVIVQASSVVSLLGGNFEGTDPQTVRRSASMPFGYVA